MKYFIYLLLLISCLFGYEDGWYALNEQDEGPIRLTLNIDNADTVRVTYSVPGFYMEADEDSSDYWKLRFKDRYEATDSLGLPQLPLICDMIAIPECDSYQIAVSYTDSTILDTITIYPVPEWECDSTDTNCYYIFTKDTTFYNTNTAYPTFVYESDDGKIRAQNVLHYTLRPFIYNASQKVLKVYKSVTITVRFFGSNDTLCVEAGPMNNILNVLLLNSDHFPRFAAPLVMDTTDSAEKHKTAKTNDNEMKITKIF